MWRLCRAVLDTTHSATAATRHCTSLPPTSLRKISMFLGSPVQKWASACGKLLVNGTWQMSGSTSCALDAKNILSTRHQYSAFDPPLPVSVPWHPPLGMVFHYSGRGLHWAHQRSEPIVNDRLLCLGGLELSVLLKSVVRPILIAKNKPKALHKHSCRTEQTVLQQEVGYLPNWSFNRLFCLNQSTLWTSPWQQPWWFGQG